MRRSPSLQWEGANCLCAWYRSQPPGRAKLSRKSPFEYLNIAHLNLALRSTMLSWSGVVGCRMFPMCQLNVSGENMTSPMWLKRADLVLFQNDPKWMQLILEPNCRDMILRTLMLRPSACSSLHLQSFNFSTTACQLLLKKPQGKVKLTNNLFKADAIKKV